MPRLHATKLASLKKLAGPTGQASLRSAAYERIEPRPDVQALDRKVALNYDLSAWSHRSQRVRQSSGTIEELWRAMHRVAGDVPSLWHFRKFFQYESEHEMPARLERAFTIVTGGRALARFHQQVHHNVPPPLEIEAGLVA